MTAAAERRSDPGGATPAIAPVLQAQREAFQRDGAPGVRARIAGLKRLRAAIVAHRGALADAVSADFGNRSRYETDIMEVVVTVQAIDYLIRRTPRFMRPERRHVSLSYRSGRAHVEYQPKGVVGIMAPWNYPCSLTMIPLATALAAGNRVMIKPSELTPRTSVVIRDMLAGAFAPEEVAVVLGGAEVGAAFSALPLDHLLFTGSTKVGRSVMRAASENLVPVTLELGGKSPLIIAKGAVTASAVKSVVFGKLSNAGQTCIAPDYALVHRDDREAFIALYDRAVREAYPAGPTGRDYSTVVNDAHYARLQALLADARERGGRALEVGCDPGTATSRVRTIAPTLVVDVPDDSAIMADEIFGPLLPVRTYGDMDEVIGFVNSRPRPLALYYFGPDGAERAQLLARTTSGNVGINNTLLHIAQDDLPFGGVGPSGMGAYHGIEGFRAMSHAKGVFTQGRWNFANLLRAPFGRMTDLAVRSVLGRPPAP